MWKASFFCVVSERKERCEVEMKIECYQYANVAVARDGTEVFHAPRSHREKEKL